MSTTLVCPFDGYLSPAAERGDNRNDGTPTWHVICPICRISTPDFHTMQGAIDYWSARVNPTNLTYVTWLAAANAFATTGTPSAADLNAWIIANPPVPDP